MNESTIKVVLVQFCDSDGETTYKEYAYFTHLDVVKDDLVVVQARGFYGIAKVYKVTGLTKAARKKATRWIVCKIDAEYLEVHVERLELINEIRNELAEEKQKYEDRMIYETLAKDNPKIAALLAKYDKLLITD